MKGRLQGWVAVGVPLTTSLGRIGLTGSGGGSGRAAGGATLGSGTALRAWARVWRRWVVRSRVARDAVTIRGQAVAQRPDARIARTPTSTSAWSRVQCIPAPVSRASITSLVARSTPPWPTG